jgi:hypothetical protein
VDFPILNSVSLAAILSPPITRSIVTAYKYLPIEDFTKGDDSVDGQKPDFSGEWILSRKDCVLSPGADAMQSAEAKIEHREPTFHYTATFVSADGPTKIDYALQSDGREVVSTHENVSIASRLGWDGDALVASWHIRRPDSELSISFKHELMDNGRRMRASEVLRGTDRQQDNIWIFDRR